MYKFEGRRTKDEFIKFAKGGYKEEKAEDIPKPLSFIEDFLYPFIQSYKQAKADVASGTYFSSDIILMVLPFMFLMTMVLICSMTPAHQYDVAKKASKQD